MLIVDSSVWIDLLRARETPETATFERLAAIEEIGLGDLMLYEVLQGVTPQGESEAVRPKLLAFSVLTMGGRDIAIQAARHSQLLRTSGFQVGTVDCLIATFCIVSSLRLLTSDRHFQPFADILGLSLAR